MFTFSGCVPPVEYVPATNTIAFEQCWHNGGEFQCPEWMNYLEFSSCGGH